MTITVHMEKSARMIAALAAVFCAASLSAATTYTVASGESLALDASTNNKANQITLEDGAKLVAPVSGDGYRIDANVYVAGAALKNGKLVTNGGRVVGCTAVADTLPEAIKDAYALASQVHFDNSFCRSDIGQRALRAVLEG